MVFGILTGIVLAACVFAALLWSLYRVTITTRWLRLVYAVLAISTILVAAAITWNLATLTLTAGLTCAVTALVALWVEPRWSKLLPLVQLVLGVMSIWAGATILF